MKNQMNNINETVAALRQELETLRQEFTACVEMNEILMMMLMPDEFIEKQSHPEYAPIPTGGFYDPGYCPSRLP
jgi:regulator of replication initiation timing